MFILFFENMEMRL